MSSKRRVIKKSPSKPKDQEGHVMIDQMLKKIQDNNEFLKKVPVVEETKKLLKDFGAAVGTTKRHIQLEESNQATKNVSGLTRSGRNRRANQKPVVMDSKWTNKGIDDSKGNFETDEMEYLEKCISKIKNVSDLKFEHLKYLVCDKFMQDLNKIKMGELSSQFHARFTDGESKSDLRSEIHVSLFTNEQRDYLYGLLLGSFNVSDMESEKTDLDYIYIVMLHESILRIVKYVFQLQSDEEALKYIQDKAAELSGGQS